MSAKWVATVGEARQATATQPSASAVYRAAGSKDAFPKLEVSTLYELFARSVEKYPNNKCLGKREKKADGTVGPYVWETYKQVGDDVAALAAGLVSLGVAPKQCVGVLGGNCPEWMKALQACNRMNMTCVPLYDSLGENAIEYIISHSGSVVAFASSDKFGNMVKALGHADVKATLKSVVYWGTAPEASVKAVKDLGYQIYSMDELIKKGQAAPTAPVPPAPSDLATIMYTSGTTGDPKGVMLAHSAVLSGATNTFSFCKLNNIVLGETDSFMSYLPLAHIFDRVTEEYFLYMGASIGYWQGDVAKLLDDVAELKPSLFVGVPRVFDRIYSRVMGGLKTAGFLKRLLFNWGMSRKLYFMKQGRKQNEASPFFDRLVFSKVAARLGGLVKVVVSGGAPLAPHVEDFLRVTMCCPVVQGYGLTETSAASFIAGADFMPHSYSVGPPTPCTELRLESVPEMNYDALDPKEPKGEVLIRGAANFTGYYKDQVKTDEVLEKDGWFHTGDIAVLTESGGLKIIDRKKNIFKLSQGEYVAVEKLESSYKKNLLAEQVWVYGCSFKSCLVAVVVPSDAIKSWAAGAGITGDMAALCANEKVKAHVLQELTGTGKAERLKGFEIVKAVHLVANQFSIEDDLLTPTFKFKRPQLQKKFQKDIDAMYAALKE